MFEWFKKSYTKEKSDNVYTAINDELERLHELLHSQLTAKQEGEGNNAATIYTRIQEIQDKLLDALKEQPSHDDNIKDLQNTVAEMVLLSGGDEEK